MPRRAFGPGRRWWWCQWVRAVAAVGTLSWPLLLLLHLQGSKWMEVMTVEAVRKNVQVLKKDLTTANITTDHSPVGVGRSVKDYLQYDDVFSNTSWVQWPLLVFSTMGRLGNCLNSYATALTFHGAHNATIAVTEGIFRGVVSLLARDDLILPVVSRKLLLEMQDMGIAEQVEPDYLKNDMVSHLLPTILRAVREYQRNGQEKVFILEGYPNRMRMLARHHHKIRHNFRIRSDLQTTASSFLDRVRASKGDDDVTFVGFHIRRGDYVHYMENFYKCSLPGPEYYSMAMNHYRNSLSKPVFVVCSDDVPRARQHLQDATTDVVFSDLSLPEEDMALLAACSHSIMTVGSFGFWASYLAGGHVVYPLLKNCSQTPFVHPDNLGPQGYSNWLAMQV